MTFRKPILLSLALSQLMLASSLANPDPNDPLSKPNMQCQIQNQPSFCDGKPTTTYNAGSCFERTAVQGCLDINNGSTVLCNWSSIFTLGIETQTPDQLCTFQANWCMRQGYSDCQTVYKTCMAANTQFKNVCMKL